MKRIFVAASALPPSERGSFLAQQCVGDAELSREVQSLLSQDDRTGSFLETPALEADPHLLSNFAFIAPPPTARPERIGRYRILDVLGEGGMGVVYLAEQENPKRAVALKVIRPGIATEDLLARFAYEAQLLGRLHHPGIAQIYEAGVADLDGRSRADVADVRAGAAVSASGQPFFAMELIEGRPLIEFCDEHDLTVRQRLALLAKVCDAVQHAHQKGIIHRDLKPGNILVEDGSSGEGAAFDPAKAQPKILDFGVARATGADVPGLRRTNVGQLIGTPAYMSPEQVAGDSHDLDTRSDVYALGVIGFELLTGRLPLNMGGKSLAECARMIRDDPLARPSTIDKSLRGDVETILCKALQKDRTQRYESASGLAADLRRYLNHLPIAARPPAMLYQLRKFVQRHRAVVIGAAAAALALAAAAWAAMHAKISDQEAEISEQRRKTASMIVGELTQGLNELPDPLKPTVNDQRKLQGYARFADEQLGDEPAVAANMRTKIGLNFMKLAQYDLAEKQLSLALEFWRETSHEDAPALAEAIHNMGRVLFYQGRYEESESHYMEALDMRRRFHGPDHADVAMTMDHLATCHRKHGQYARAEQFARDALSMRQRVLGDDNDNGLIAASHTSLAICLSEQGRYKEAEEQFKLGVEMIERLAEAKDLRVAAGLHNWAECLIELGWLDEAQNHLIRAEEIQRDLLPDSHPAIASTTYLMARLRHEQGDDVEAHRLCRRALAAQESLLDQTHIDLARTRHLLGSILLAQDRPAEAETLLRRALRVRIEEHPSGAILIAQSQSELGGCLTAMRQFEEAEQLLLDSHNSSSAGNHPAVLQTRTLKRLVDLYKAIGQPQLAEQYRELLEQWDQSDQAGL